MEIIHFAVFVLAISALIWCWRYLYISWKAIIHHKRELARMAQVADPETMEKLKFDPHKYDEAVHLDEEVIAERIRQTLKTKQSPQ